jgi:hypothetical protein
VSSSQEKDCNEINVNHHVVAEIQAFAILLAQPVIICDSSQVVITSKSKSIFNALITLGVGR